MWSQFRSAIAGSLVTMLGTAAIAAQPSILPPTTVSTPASASNVQAVASIEGAGHALSKADADAWLDGFMPYALHQDDIAGAEVVIVKDGQVLTERGFGYADMATRKPVDPALTMFRVGSVSKLFTWTAVMQLVEQGKIDLDADVNDYIDFKIPPFRDRPISMRDLTPPGSVRSSKVGSDRAATSHPWAWW
jgi:CubicO group peptidase (beta-lactamase class C family)